MKDQLEAVSRFHEAFGLGKADLPTANLEKDKVLLRHRLMAEENGEYLEAALSGDLEQVADALGDMLYILCGTILEHGMQEVIEPVFEAIQKSNMSKLGSDGRPVYRKDGKVLKGPGYESPEIGRVLKRYTSE